MRTPMTLNIHVANFKFRQYQLRAVLMLAKITRYNLVD